MIEFLALMALVGAIVALRISVLARRVNVEEFEKNRHRVKSFRESILGRVRISDDWLPDGRVRGGMVFNQRENRLEISGKLSEDSVSRAFR